MTDSVAHPTDQVYTQLKNLFAVGDQQLFTMEFPGRVLDEAQYVYDVDTIFSNMTKPQEVLEAEFRLADGMLDVAQIVGGPNGKQLSITYDSALNRLVPAYTSGQAVFTADKEKIRDWLLETVSAVVDDGGTTTTLTMSRIELYDYLNDRYLRALANWHKTKTGQLETAMAVADPDQRATALEVFARWLANEAIAIEADLESKFADLIVKGYYHEVRNQLGYIDISSASEALEAAKARLRASGLSSLDETETVYPVQFEPADWFRSLSTDFTPVDLLMDPATLQQELVEQQQQLEQLQDAYTLLQSGQTGDPTALKAQVAAAQQALDTAQTQLTVQFTDSVITVAKIYFGTVDPANVGQQGLDATLKKAGLGSLTADEWTDIQNGVTAVANAQQQLTQKSRALTDLMAEEAAAETTSATQALGLLQSKIDSLRQSVQDLQVMLTSAAGLAAQKAQATQPADGSTAPVYKKDVPSSIPNYQPLPTQMPAAGEFFDVVLEFDSSSTYQASQLASSASQTSWNVDLFFGSAGGSSSASSSSAASQVHTTDLSIKLGFRATKVTIDRGGWFEPEAFSGTSEMYTLGDGLSSISYGTLAGTGQRAYDTLNAGVFPTYPVSFVIAKDVTMLIDISKLDQTTRSAFAQAADSESGGCFCFSVSHSASSSSSSKAYFMAQSGTMVIIKIPGPQILGWFVDYVPTDMSVPYAAMPDGYLPKTAAELLAGRALDSRLVTLPDTVPASTPVPVGVTASPAAGGNGGGAELGPTIPMPTPAH
jgi:hypothetical protein